MARTEITASARKAVRDMGKSASFDGTSSYCTVPITPSTAGFSFSMWLKLDRGIGNNARILDWQESGPTNGFTYIVVVTGSRLSIQPRFYNAGSLDGQPTAYEPNTNDWVHTVVTYEPNNLKFYINGTLWSQDTSITMNASATTLTLGKRTGGSFATGYKGLMDGFVFLNGRAMTATEVASLYSAGQHPDDTSCHIRFNDNVIDETKNKNNLTAVSLTYLSDVPIINRTSVTTPRRNVNNLVFNGDFEYAPTFTAATNTAARFVDGTASGSISNSIYGWSVSGSNGFAAQFDTTEYKTGTKSIKLSTTSTGSYAELFIPTYQNGKAAYFGKVIPVQPSTSYTYSFWMKTNLVSGTATNGAYVAIVFSDAGGASNASCTPTINTTIVKTTQDWTQYSGTFTTTSVDAFAQINLRIYGHQGTATLIMDAWFDDIVLTKTTPDTRVDA